MRARPYDPRRRGGWARGLIHFHTRFSDGWASVLRAGEMAIAAGFDFLIVTDHLQLIKLRARRTPAEYIAACDEATRRLGLPVIPGGEMEVHWSGAPTSDFSEAHTLAMSVRPLAGAGGFDWETPDAAPYAHWPDSAGGRGTVLALQEMLRRHGLPPMASHQFQHSPWSLKAGQHQDYRYELERLATSRYVDFFYSGALDLMHEMEDLALVARHAAGPPEALKAVYSSCDYHVGPETTWPPLAAVIERVPPLAAAYRWLFRTLTSLRFRLITGPEATVSPYFGEEQLTHATYVYLGERPCTEGTVLEALREGRTVVTRGAAEFAGFAPAPDLGRVHEAPVRFSLDLRRSYSEPRPRSVIVLRDGAVAHWIVSPVADPAIRLAWTDPAPPPGVHVYQVYVPSKFLSSPVLVAA